MMLNQFSKKLAKHIIQSQFFQTRSSYAIIQINPQPKKIDLIQLQKQYGSIIASTLRLETEILAEHQKK